MNRNQVTAAIRRMADGGTAEVVDVVKALRAEEEPDRVHRFLRELEREGRIQLLPSRVPRQDVDRVLCVPGPRGSLLSRIVLADVQPGGREPFSIEFSGQEWALLYDLAAEQGSHPREIVKTVVKRWLSQQRNVR